LVVRNQARFKGKKFHWKNAVTLILANFALSGNNRKQTYYNSMTDFMILKKFSVEIHPPRAPLIKEVMWLTPTPKWLTLMGPPHHPLLPLVEYLETIKLS
jgi:hypothetical protein